MIEQAKTFWQSLSFSGKGVAILAIVTLIALAMGASSQFTSYRKEKAFDKAIEAQKKERQRETDRANAAEARAVKLEAEKQKYQIIVELAGEKVKAATQRVQDAETKFNKEIEEIDRPVDDCERYQRIRQKLGLAFKTCE